MHTSIQVAIGVAAGIGTAHRFESVHWAVWLSLLLMYVLSLHTHKFRAVLLAALLGASLFSLQMRLHNGVIDSHKLVLDDRVEELVTGKITGLPERMPGRVRVLLVTSDARIWLTLFFEGARAQLHLMPGQWIRVSARLKSPRGLRGLGTMNKGEQALAHGADLLASAPLASVEVFDESFSGWTLPVLLHDWAAREIASSSGSADGKHLVAAIAIGERGGMRPTLSNALRSSGIAHLIAVSGMHLAAVAGLVYFLVLVLWAWLPWRQYLEPASVAAGAALCAALLFTGVTGARASTCRALLVAAFMLVGIMLDRRIRMMHAIAWAAFLLLVFNPILLWEPGFQMSFAATGVLALAFQKAPQLLPAEPLSRLGKIRGHAVDLFRASFWASLATAPIALYHFGQVAPVALLTNLIAVPFATLLLLPLSLVALIVIPLSESLGQWLLLQATKCADVVVWASRAIDSVLPAVSRPPMNALELLLWLSFVLVLLRGRREGSTRMGHRRTIVLASALAMIFGVSRAYWGEYQARESESLRVTFVDIGQGDAAVIELPGGAVWLVDGGGLPFVAAASSEERQYLGESPARRALLPYLRHRRINAIDLAILSHPHPDHYLGLQAVAREMPIAELWSVHEKRETPGQFELWLERLERGGTVVRSPRLGLAWSERGVDLQVLWPRYEGPIATPDPILSVNDNSLVVRIDFAGRRILFTGDIESEAEELLVSEYAPQLVADVVKVAHHGSPTSSTRAFAEAIGPAVAVISCGVANRFNFPGPEVVERWLDSAHLLLRTDEVGSVSVEISPDGEMQIETSLPF